MQCVVYVFASGWVDGENWDVTKISSARLELNLVVGRWKASENLPQINAKQMSEANDMVKQRRAAP
jgi:hypothetical protein